mmetsp:Transcript_24453/g.38112  ORF Transcript_24453/g.38112 Transcript_24453/m.38112 type:complete len:163 (-) Transcript_24453:19-507(-)
MLLQHQLRNGLSKNFARTALFTSAGQPILHISSRGCCGSNTCGCAEIPERASKEASIPMPQVPPEKKPLAKRRPLSGMQRSILSLYRSFLRIAFKKTEKESKENLLAFIRGEFQKHVHINKWDFTRIEYLIHKGERQLEALKKCKSTDKFQFYRPPSANSGN